MTLTPSTSSSPTICLTYTDTLGGRIDTASDLRRFGTASMTYLNTESR